MTTTDPNALAGGAPPHNEEAESSVLGAILLAPNWLDTLTTEVGLSPDDFHRPRHRTIFAAILDLDRVGRAIDTLTVSEQLGSELESVGGSDYVETLVARIPAIANTRQYGTIVRENSIKRKLVRASQEIQSMIAGNDRPTLEMLEHAQNLVAEVAANDESGKLIEFSDLIHDHLAEIEERGKRKETLTGISTGLRDLDEITHGLQPGALYVVGARPSMGKSAFAPGIAAAAAFSDYPVAYFTMEMNAGETIDRFLAKHARMQGEKLRTGSIEGPGWSRLFKAGEELSGVPIYIDDSADLTVRQIRSRVRRASHRRKAKGQKPIELVVIDYLQMLRVEDSRAPRAYQIEEQTRALKRMARELKIPVVILSQLSREVEKRSPPIPQLSDLKDSGSIEQDADVVILLYREDYYRSDSERPGEADLIVAKQRGGKTGTAQVSFVAHYPGFDDLVLQEKVEPPPEPIEFVVGRDDPGREPDEEPVF